MRLRARLALVALALILVPIIVMSLISLDSRIDTMIEDMARSTDFMIEQIFEQVRLALEQGNGDVASKLKDSEPVRKVLDSTVAFGPGVVSAALVGTDGKIIVAAHGGQGAALVDGHHHERGTGHRGHVAGGHAYLQPNFGTARGSDPRI